MDEADPILEGLAAQLNASGDYRIQKRLRTRTIVTAEDGTPTRMGLFIDVETTGLDLQKDEIIELAMVPFTYSLDGRIFEIRRAFQGFQEPSAPISAAITKITGITDDMVAGHRIDSEEVRSFASGAAARNRAQCCLRSALRRADQRQLRQQALGLFDDAGRLVERRA